MKKQFLHRQILFLPLVFILFISCSQKNSDSGGYAEQKEKADSLQVTTGSDEPKTIDAGPQETDDPNFVVSKDTVSAHGPRSITRNVHQDKNGNMWFATWEGIICYDGKRFTNITLKEGLRHFHVFSILEDSKGTLWFGTIGGGVYRYDGKRFNFFTTADGLVGNVVLCMIEDRAGNIWFGTSEGVSRYSENVFTNFKKQEGLNDNFVSTIIQENSDSYWKGKIWFGTNGGINCFDPSSESNQSWRRTGERVFSNFTINKDSSFHNVRSIIKDNKGNIWIGSQDGVYCYDGKSLTNFTKKYPGNIIYEDKKGNFWLSENNPGGRGMALHRYDGKSITKIYSNDNQVFGITEDRSGNIWIGTARGVWRYDGEGVGGFGE